MKYLIQGKEPRDSTRGNLHSCIIGLTARISRFLVRQSYCPKGIQCFLCLTQQYIQQDNKFCKFFPSLLLPHVSMSLSLPHLCLQLSAYISSTLPLNGKISCVVTGKGPQEFFLTKRLSSASAAKTILKELFVLCSVQIHFLTPAGIRGIQIVMHK